MPRARARPRCRRWRRARARSAMREAARRQTSKHHDHHQREEFSAIGHDLVARDAERRDAGNAHVALRHRLPLDRDLVHDQSDRQRGHRKIVALEPQRRPAHHQRNQQGEPKPHGKGRDRLPVISRGENRRGVARQCREGVVPERHLSGKSHEDVQPDDEHRVDHRERHDGNEIAAGNEGIGQHRAGHHPRQRREPAPHPVTRDNSGRVRHGI